MIGHHKEYNYFHFSDSRRNTNWILQHDTTFEQALSYAIGYVDAAINLGQNYDGIIYFDESCKTWVDKDLELCIMSEKDFQERVQSAAREEFLKVVL